MERKERRCHRDRGRSLQQARELNPLPPTQQFWFPKVAFIGTSRLKYPSSVLNISCLVDCEASLVFYRLKLGDVISASTLSPRKAPSRRAKCGGSRSATARKSAQGRCNWTRRDRASIIAPSSGVHHPAIPTHWTFAGILTTQSTSLNSGQPGTMPPKKVGQRVDRESSIEKTEEYEDFLKELAAYHEKRG